LNILYLDTNIGLRIATPYSLVEMCRPFRRELPSATSL